jgi:hypothetical protein
MLQVLTAVPTATTTKVENVDDRALGVSELTIRERPPSTLRNVDDGPTGGAGAGDPEAQRLRSPPFGHAVNGCKNLGINAQIVVRTHFTLTQVGHFC